MREPPRRSLFSQAGRQRPWRRAPPVSFSAPGWCPRTRCRGRGRAATRSLAAAPGERRSPALKRCVLLCCTGAGGPAVVLQVAGRTLVAPGSALRLRRHKMAGAPRSGTQFGRRAQVAATLDSSLRDTGPDVCCPDVGCCLDPKLAGSRCRCLTVGGAGGGAAGLHLCLTPCPPGELLLVWATTSEGDSGAVRLMLPPEKSED
ncbi:hypothetical protein NDU88_001995 [Pleurodeles waltl]|uniref:Uncharacterized protein n=1 Tax=Pleurodeles waltl TaxID=8319 RepID=A0AAV7REE5_PLEWA|nr:hypothetical protein NDU88_001995 [Pleurodeles waltl]